MKKKILLFCFLLLGFSLYAEAQVELPETIQQNRNAYVFEDPRIDLLVKQQRYMNTLRLRNITGYRVQVLSTRDRSKAKAARAKLMRLYPQYKSYLTYQSPYFRVRVGNFLQKDSADELQKKLGRYFPQGVFSVKSKIKIDPKDLLKELKVRNDSTD